MKIKFTPVAVAVILASSIGTVQAEGWSFGGYGMSNYRLVDDASVNGDFGKSDYRTFGTSSKNANQAEITAKRSVEYDEGVYSNFVLRAEYGNGESAYGSSAGSEDADADGPFELKESYVVLGNLPYFGEGTEVWAGRRFLNRSSGLISGEFWKQTSGVGTGFEKTIKSGGKFGIAMLSADVNATSDGKTLTSTDLYYYGVKALGGSFDFDIKSTKQANNDVDGLGWSITYNRDYYGMDGWSQTILAKGTGLNTNRGVNFGSWVNGFSADAESTFFSTYGVANLTDKLQMGSEITQWDLKDVWGQDSVKRTLFAVRPSYIVNNNLRLEFTAGVGIEELGTPSAWGRADKSVTFKTFEFAPVLTTNADYFGRPQIKPYVTYYKADSGYGNQIGLANSKDSDLVFGVQSEIWF